MTNLIKLGNHQNKPWKPYWFVALSLFFFNVAFANDSLVIEQYSKYVVTDKLGQIYIVNLNDELLKYDAQGRQQFLYFDRTLGEISYIDATNPFQVMVFFEDFQTIVWLDRTLNPMSSINLSDFGFFQVNTIGVASDNRIWLYDNTTFQIKKIDSQGQVITESLELNNLADNLNPNFILEKNNRVYLNNPQTGIFVFDNFGQFIETIPITGLTVFQVLENQLWYYKVTEFYSYHFQTLQTQAVDLPFQAAKTDKIFKQKNNWYWIKKEAVVILKK